MAQLPRPRSAAGIAFSIGLIAALGIGPAVAQDTDLPDPGEMEWRFTKPAGSQSEPSCAITANTAFEELEFSSFAGAGDAVLTPAGGATLDYTVDATDVSHLRVEIDNHLTSKTNPSDTVPLSARNNIFGITDKNSSGLTDSDVSGILSEATLDRYIITLAGATGDGGRVHFDGTISGVFSVTRANYDSMDEASTYAIGVVLTCYQSAS